MIHPLESRLDWNRFRAMWIKECEFQQKKLIFHLLFCLQVRDDKPSRRTAITTRISRFGGLQCFSRWWPSDTIAGHQRNIHRWPKSGEWKIAHSIAQSTMLPNSKQPPFSRIIIKWKKCTFYSPFARFLVDKLNSRSQCCFKAFAHHSKVF